MNGGAEEIIKALQEALNPGATRARAEAQGRRNWERSFLPTHHWDPNIVSVLEEEGYPARGPVAMWANSYLDPNTRLRRYRAPDNFATRTHELGRNTAGWSPSPFESQWHDSLGGATTYGPQGDMFRAVGQPVKLEGYDPIRSHNRLMSYGHFPLGDMRSFRATLPQSPEPNKRFNIPNPFRR